jgi:hypothetical protein
MGRRFQIRILAALGLAALLSGCGGTGGSGSGGGGGGGGNGPSIVVSPSSYMMTAAVGSGTLVFNVLGKNFSQQAQILVDGQPPATSVYVDANTLSATENVTFSSFLGTHKITVQDGSNVSDAGTYTLYTPQQGPLVMQATPGYTPGLENDPIYVAAGDLNGDGLADVIVQGPVDGFQSDVAILFGQADGTLSGPTYLTNVIPYSLTIADVDGNGTADLVTITTDNSSNTVLEILLGDGRGNFGVVSGAQKFSGIFPSAPQVVDLDGDGKPDVIISVAATGGNNLIWFKNLGGGLFAVPVTLPTVQYGNSFAIADVNGDGKPDIVYQIYNATASAALIHTLVNQGNGQFLDTVAQGLNGVTGPFAVMDFNLDGKPDLVVQAAAPGGGIALYSFTGVGDGTFSSAATTTLSAPVAYETFQLASGDFDHDGFPDLVGVDIESSPGHIVYLFGDGQGNFTPLNVVGPQGWNLVAVADVNGDGMPDVIVPDRFNVVSVSLGRKDRNFPSLQTLLPNVSAPPSIGDVNGDGHPEIYVGGDNFFDVPATVLLNLGNGTFTFGASAPFESNAAADLTGKGVVDLIGGNAAELFIWPNTGGLFFGSQITVPPPVQGNFTVADMDQDGHPDIVELGGVLYGDGAYQFTAVPTSQTFQTYAIGDFNGDGRPDIASDTFVFLNTGNRTFKTVSAGVGAPNLGQGSIPIVADFNGDGLDDIGIVWPMQSPQLEIYYSRGDGTFYPGAILDIVDLPGGLPGYGSIATADYDGDGRPDIAVGLWNTEQVVIFFNQGNGQFKRAFFASGANSIGMASGELVQKGKSDLVISNYNLAFRPSNVTVMLHK